MCVCVCVCCVCVCVCVCVGGGRGLGSVGGAVWARAPVMRRCGDEKKERVAVT